MDAVVHIGLSKTGTTTIQTALRKNEDALKSQGILYPNLFGERSGQVSLYAYVLRNNIGNISPFVRSKLSLKQPKDLEAFSVKFEQRFKETLQEGNPHTVVYSCEFLSNLRKPDVIAPLRELLAAHFDKLKIVLYLRRQEDRILSQYSQNLKHGGLVDQETFIKQRNPIEYKNVINDFASVFHKDELDIRLLESDFMINGNLIDDFMSCIGANTASIQKPDRKNESISSESAEFLRYFNKYVPIFNDNKEVNNKRIGLVAILEEYSKGQNKMFLTEEQIEQVRMMCADTNEAIRSTYFPDRPMLFQPKAPTAKNERPAEVSKEDLVRVAAHVIANHRKLEV